MTEANMKGRFFPIALCVGFIILASSCATAMKAPSMAALESSGERMIAYNAYITFEVKEVDATRMNVIDKCKQSNGFVTRETNDRLILRVPVADFETFVKKINELGKISKSEIRGEDITDSYEDIALQLESKLQLRERYTSILRQATTVGDLIALEKELERINLEIQRLEGMKSASEKKVQYITVTVDIEKKITPGPLGWIFYLGYKTIEWLFVWK